MTDAPPSMPDELLDELPAELRDDFVHALEDQPPERLRAAARFAEALAEHRTREGRPDDVDLDDTDADGADDGDSDDPDADDSDADDGGAGDSDADAGDVDAGDRPESVPDDVPSKATLTVKDINDNRYYYWQWREGDAIRSRYEGPVDADG